MLSVLPPPLVLCPTDDGTDRGDGQSDVDDSTDRIADAGGDPLRVCAFAPRVEERDEKLPEGVAGKTDSDNHQQDLTE